MSDFANLLVQLHIVIFPTDPLPPTVSIVHSSLSVMAGGSLTLNCSASVQQGITGSPTLMWTRGGDHLPDGASSDGPSLTFDPLLTSHGGVYTCTVRLTIPEAGVDVAGANTTRVVVQSMQDNTRLSSQFIFCSHLVPQPTISIRGNNTFFQGLVITFICRVVLHSAVDSPVTVRGSWERNGTQLQSSGDRITVTNTFSAAPPNYDITIRLEPIRYSDSGMYSCSANVTAQSSEYVGGVEMPLSSQQTVTVKGLCLDLSSCVTSISSVYFLTTYSIATSHCHCVVTATIS